MSTGTRERGTKMTTIKTTDTNETFELDYDFDGNLAETT
jgi:hypothetical protein